MHSGILNEYVQGTSILDLAKKYNFPPSLFARTMVEHTTIYENKKVTIALRDPLRTLSSVDVILKEYRDSENIKMILVDDEASVPKANLPVDPFSGIAIEGSSKVTRLAREVIAATNADPMYGMCIHFSPKIIFRPLDISLLTNIFNSMSHHNQDPDLIERGIMLV